MASASFLRPSGLMCPFRAVVFPLAAAGLAAPLAPGLFFAGAALLTLVPDFSAALFAAQRRFVASIILLRPSGLICLFWTVVVPSTVAGVAAPPWVGPSISRS